MTAAIMLYTNDWIIMADDIKVETENFFNLPPPVFPSGSIVCAAVAKTTGWLSVLLRV